MEHLHHVFQIIQKGVASSIPSRSHTFVEILIIQEGFIVSYKRKYVHKVLVNCLFKLAQEKCG